MQNKNHGLPVLNELPKLTSEYLKYRKIGMEDWMADLLEKNDSARANKLRNVSGDLQIFENFEKFLKEYPIDDDSDLPFEELGEFVLSFQFQIIPHTLANPADPKCFVKARFWMLSQGDGSFACCIINNITKPEAISFLKAVDSGLRFFNEA